MELRKNLKNEGVNIARFRAWVTSPYDLKPNFKPNFSDPLTNTIPGETDSESDFELDTIDEDRFPPLSCEEGDVSNTALIKTEFNSSELTDIKSAQIPTAVLENSLGVNLINVDQIDNNKSLNDSNENLSADKNISSTNNSLNETVNSEELNSSNTSLSSDYI